MERESGEILTTIESSWKPVASVQQDFQTSDQARGCPFEHKRSFSLGKYFGTLMLIDIDPSCSDGTCFG